MNNFVIAIPSKGRLTSFTFNILKSVSLAVPVYVYTDEKESDAYEEYFPQFNIVPHNKKGIGAIRRFIQEEQAKAGNTVFMIDDDIIGFYDESAEYGVSLKKILNTIESLLNQGYDALGFRTIYQEDDSSKIYKMAPDDLPYFFAAYVITPKLYANGIRFSEDDCISEDTDFSIQVNLRHDIVKPSMLPYSIRYLSNDPSTHFESEWRVRARIKLYEKYGNLIKLHQNLSVITATHENDYNKYNHYKEHGPVYTKKSNNALVSMWENKFLDDDFMLPVLETCRCKKDEDGKYCFDWDYGGHDGRATCVTYEETNRGFECLV